MADFVSHRLRLNVPYEQEHMYLYKTSVLSIHSSVSLVFRDTNHEPD